MWKKCQKNKNFAKEAKPTKRERKREERGSKTKSADLSNLFSLSNNSYKYINKLSVSVSNHFSIDIIISDSKRKPALNSVGVIGKIGGIKEWHTNSIQMAWAFRTPQWMVWYPKVSKPRANISMLSTIHFEALRAQWMSTIAAKRSHMAYSLRFLIHCASLISNQINDYPT